MIKIEIRCGLGQVLNLIFLSQIKSHKLIPQTWQKLLSTQNQGRITNAEMLIIMTTLKELITN